MKQKSSGVKGSGAKGSGAKGSGAQGRNIKLAPVKVSIWVHDLSPVRQGGTLLAVAAVGTIALLSWGGWLAVSLIANPGSVIWLNDVLPEWGRFALSGGTTQTLAEIAAEEARLGRTLGEPIAVGSLSSATQDLLLPILETQSRCRGNRNTGEAICWQIVELRAYRPSGRLGAETKKAETQFELVDRLKVTGIEELMAIASLRQVGGSSRKLPLTQAALIEGKPPDASVWLNLSGEWQRGSAEVKYGQVVRYDPQHDRLQVLLPWTSPAGQMPHWQQVTGAAAGSASHQTVSELVVNQTVGLEPQFQVYQVRLPHAPGESLRLEAIALTEVVSDQPRYRDGLLLARNGLWSPALMLLVDQEEQGSQSAAVQAQIDFIALHAQITQAQADRTWASPTQQIAALVIDGRWTKALEVLRSARVSGYDIKSLLSANAESLQRRVDAALRVDPNQPLVRQWGAMTVASQRDRSAAVTWLRQHPLHLGVAMAAERSPRFIQQILALLDPIGSSSDSSSSPSQIANAAPDSHLRALGLIGTVSPLTSIRASDWYSPRPLVLPDRQVWYQIEILGFQYRQQWQRSPFALFSSETSSETSSGKAAWQRLGLTPDSPIQIVGAEVTSAQTASIKAVQWRNGNLRLLAAAPRSSQADQGAIAVTLPWLTPIDSLTLANLSQQQPQQTAVLLTALEQQLQQSGQRLPAAQSHLLQSQSPESQALAQVGDWQIDRLELTGEGQPELVIAIKTETDKTNTPPGNPSSHTVIFSSAGKLLYSDLSLPDQTIAAIVDIPHSPPVLVIHTGQGYQIQQWSQSQQRLE